MNRIIFTICKRSNQVISVIRNYGSIDYVVKDRVANITLNRPERCNAIDELMPQEIQQAVNDANADHDVKVLQITGSGNAFCSGYDLKKFAEAHRGSHACSQDMPWDPYTDFYFMSRCNDCYKSLWNSLKPTIAKINGDCIAGGTDIALNCDITFISETARIGYPPARVWGCPTGAMWFYRLGTEKAKRMLFTGQLINGVEAVEWGLIGECAPKDELNSTVDRFVSKIIEVPTNQLFFQKQVINNAVEMLGLGTSQRLATFLDGMTRHTPEGVQFQQKCEQFGFKKVVMERDDKAKRNE